MSEYFFRDTPPPIQLNEHDIINFLLLLKKRMTPEEKGLSLVKEMKYFTRSINRIKFDQELTEDNVPHKFRLFLAKAYPNDDRYAGFQLRGFNALLNDFDNDKVKSIVISAPTASGKSKVFLAPAIFNALNRSAKAIIIYPRLSLMRDQFSNLLDIWSELQEKNLSIGIQRKGIGSNDFITINYGLNEGDSFLMSRLKGEVPGVALRDVICPKCGNPIWAPIGPAGKPSEVGPFSCQNSNCNLKNVNIFVSKDKIIAKKPHLLLTTADSVNALLFKRNFRDYLEQCEYIVFDEAHAYESVNGAHIANLIKRLRLINDNLKIVLSSATIPNPIEFAEKLTGIDQKKILLVEPEGTENDISGAENYRLLKVSDDKKVGTPSVFLQLLLMLTHSVNINTNPSREKILSFLDSRDLVNRFFYEFKDADQTRKLANFRIEKGKYILRDFYKCPTGSEDRCDLNFCSAVGQPYFEGECWFGLTSSYFNQRNQPKKSNIKLARVMSGLSEPIENVDLILSTSSMELGIDDQSINTVVQYRAPPSIYSFIQRKGRGGRDRNSRTSNIWFVGGHESSDRFYFNNLDTMLTLPYHIPLNPSNSYAVWVSDVLKYIHEKLEEEMSKRIAGGENEGDYSLEFSSVFSVIDEGFFPLLYRQKLKSIGIQSDELLTKNTKRKLQEALEREMKKNHRLLTILTPTNQDIFDSIAQECQITLDNEQCNEQIKVMELSLGKNDVNSYKNSYFILVDLFKEAQFDPQNGERATGVINLLNQAPKLVKFKEAVERNRMIIYENKAFKEFKASLDKSDPYYASLPMIRSIYYWLQAHPELHNSVPFPGGIKYLMPLNFFSVGETIALDVAQISQGETNFHDFISRYLPHRLTFYSGSGRPRESRLTLRYRVSSRGFIKGKGYFINAITDKILGSDRTFNDKTGIAHFVEPSILDLEEIRTTSETDEVKYCPICFNLFSDDQEVCPYHKKALENGRVFSRALYRYVIGNQASREIKVIMGVNLRYYNLYLLLEGERLRVTPPDFKIKNVNLKFEVPYGKEITQLPVIGIKIKKPEEKRFEYLKRIFLSKGKDDFSLRDYLHSISHMFVKLVSFISGVSTEYITYQIDEDESTVQIFEMSETDTGIADSFIDSIYAEPYNFVKTLLEVSNCKTHQIDIEVISRVNGESTHELDDQYSARMADISAVGLSEKDVKAVTNRYQEWVKNPEEGKFGDISNVKHVDHVISCLDGCPDCVQLNNCHEQEQEESVSRVAIEMYVSSLFKELTLSQFEDGEYKKKLIDRDGIIYETRNNKIIWFEI